MCRVEYCRINLLCSTDDHALGLHCYSAIMTTAVSVVRKFERILLIY